MTASSAALALAVVLCAAAARGQEASQVDRAAAESLFREGRRLMAAGKTSEACLKFAESQRLDPGGGTLLNLGLCHEAEGKLATAWVELREALAMARREGHRSRIAIAEEHIAAVEPRLPRLDVKAPSEPAGVTVVVDGTALGLESWSSGVPLNPGEHTVEVTAAGYEPWRATATLREAEHTLVEPPPLLRLPEPPLPPPLVPAPPPLVLPPPPPVLPPPLPEPEPAESGPAMRIAGWTLVAASGVGLGIGLTAGVVTLVRKGESDDECPEERCTALGVSLNDEAKRAAIVSDVGFGVGLGLLATGVLILLVAPSDAQDAASEPLELRF